MLGIFFISRINLSSGRTNVYNAVKTCEALNSQNGFEAKFITTDQPKDVDKFFQRQGIRKTFELICLGLTNTSSKYIGYKWHELWWIILTNSYFVWYFWKKRREFDVLYFRDGTLSPSAVLAKFFLGKKIFFESHSVLQNKYAQFFNWISVRFTDGVIAISSGLKDHYQKINRNIILSLCSAAEDSWFNYSRDKYSFREELKLPTDKFLIGYTGVVGPNPNGDVYEVDDILRSLKNLPENVVLVIVGEINGNAEWLRIIAKEEKVSNRIIIYPWQERSIIPRFLQAFDAVLIPRRKKDLIGDSPAKMFPALASHRPIIAGRAECIEEVLTDGMDAATVKTNSPEGWKEAILKVYESTDFSRKISDRAIETSYQYTWEKRGGQISAFIAKSL